MTQDTMPREPNTACSPIQAPTVPSHPHPVCYDYVADDSDSDSTDLVELQFYDACPPSNDRYSVTPSGRSLAALNSKCADYPTLIDSCDMVAPNSTEVDNDTNNIFGIYSTVLASGIPNYRGARIPLSHKLNIVAWRQYYPNNPVLVDFLEFGFPLSYCLPYMPTPAFSNHSSAVHFPRDIDAYIKTELDHNAIQGPFPQPPFTPTFQTNALMTRPKRASDTRRVILDLSFPDQLSVNAGIPRDSYLGEYCKLSLPTPLDLRREILRHGKGCYLWSLDLSRGYRQLRTCPLDWPLLGIRWKGQYYFDTAVPFGVRWGAMYMQSTSAAVTDILQRDDITSLAYIDDIAGVNTSHEDAQRCFNRARALLAELGLAEAASKASPPNTVMVWLGVLFDTTNMTMAVPETKIKEVMTLASRWLNSARCTKTQLRKFLGKLFHIATCCETLRLFCNRLLETLRAAPNTGYVTLGPAFHADIRWILQYLPMYNGIQMIPPKPTLPTAIFVDSCPSGVGGHFQNEIYHTELPHFIQTQNRPIVDLEMLNIVIAIKLWAPKLQGHVVRVRCDNAAAVSVLQTGRGRASFLLSCAREIWRYTAEYKFQIQVSHVPGEQNTLADALSRHHLSPSYRTIVDHHVINSNSVRLEIEEYMFKLSESLKDYSQW